MIIPKVNLFSVQGRQLGCLSAVLLACTVLACSATRPVTGLKPATKQVKTSADAGANEREKADQNFYDAAILRAQDKDAEALPYFLEVLKAKPGQAAALYHVGDILLQQNQALKAIPYAAKASGQDAHNTFYALLLASCFERSNQLAKATAILQASVKLNPNADELRFRLAQYYLAGSQFDKALAQYDTLEVRTGYIEDIVQQKQRIYMQTKQMGKAIAEIKHLIDLYPDEPQYYQLLYQTYLYFEKYDEGMSVLEQLLVIDPNNDMALFKLAEYYSDKKNREKADYYINRALLSPGVAIDSKVNYINSMVPLAADSTVKANIHKYTSTVYNQNPTSASVLALKGTVYQLDNKLDSAGKYFRASLVKNQVNEIVWERLLDLDYKAGNFTALRDESEQAMETFPDQYQFAYLNGFACQQLKSYKASITALKRVLKLNPSNESLLTDVYSMLGTDYHYLKDYAGSDTSFTKALELDPSNPLTLNNYAYFLAVRGERLDQAYKMMSQVMQEHAENASYQDTYGYILYRQKNYDAALPWIEKAYHQEPSAEVIEHLGDVYFMTGKPDRALELWREALSKDEKNEALQQKIKRGKLE